MSRSHLGHRGAGLGLAICLVGALSGGRPAAGAEFYILGSPPKVWILHSLQQPGWTVREEPRGSLWILGPYVGSRIEVPRQQPRPTDPLHPSPDDMLRRQQIPIGFDLGYGAIRLFVETEVWVRPFDRPTLQLIDPNQANVKGGLQISF